MNHTIEDSKNYDVVCISFGKEKERGIEVTENGSKDSFLEQTMEIKAKSSELQSNGRLKGNNIHKFNDYKKLKENNKNRLTKHALEMAIARGEEKQIINYNLARAKKQRKVVDIKVKRKEKDAGREELA